MTTLKWSASDTAASLNTSKQPTRMSQGRRGRDVHLTEVTCRESIRVSDPLQTSRRNRPPFSSPARQNKRTQSSLTAPPTTAVYHDLGQVPGADPRHEGYNSRDTTALTSNLPPFLPAT